MTKREIIYKLIFQGKSVNQICQETGFKPRIVYKYRAELEMDENKVDKPKMSSGFWDEWEYAIYMIFHGLSRKKVASHHADERNDVYRLRDENRRRETIKTVL